jgi:membrane protease YdiL (CAAX protease family)
MSQNSSSKTTAIALFMRWRMLILLPLWVYLCFTLAQIILAAIILLLRSIGVPLDSVNSSVITTVLAAVIYLLSLALVIGVPMLLKRRTTLDDVGYARPPKLFDILLGPIGFAIYFILSALLMFGITFLADRSLFLTQFFNLNQVQDTGFNQLTEGYQYILAFLTLVVIAPVAEETLFRGFLFGKLRRYVPLWVAILVTSALFGFLHAEWSVGIDTFALSIILCLLRVYSKSLWAPILLHMIKNGLAYYILFINPLLLHTL